MSKSCADCKEAFTEDYGYSNLTVEGKYIHCTAGLMPDGNEPIDAWYGADPKLKTIAEACAEFEPGGPWFTIDVDREEVADLDPDQAAAYEGFS